MKLGSERRVLGRAYRPGLFVLLGIPEWAAGGDADDGGQPNITDVRGGGVEDAGRQLMEESLGDLGC